MRRALKSVALVAMTAAVAVMTFAVSGCGTTLQLVSAEGSGNVITRQVAVDGFDAVNIQGQFRVTVTQGDEYRVTVKIDDNLVQDLDIHESGTRISLGDRVIRDHTLQIRLRTDRSYNLRNATLVVDVVTPRLSHVDVSGASQLTLKGFEDLDEMRLSVSGAGRVLGELDCRDIDLDASGSAFVRLTGDAEDLSVHASGAAHVDLRSLPTDGADVDASGAAMVDVTVASLIDARASGASRVTYDGTARPGHVSTSGIASVMPQ